MKYLSSHCSLKHHSFNWKVSRWCLFMIQHWHSSFCGLKFFSHRALCILKRRNIINNSSWPFRLNDLTWQSFYEVNDHPTLDDFDSFIHSSLMLIDNCSLESLIKSSFVCGRLINLIMTFIRMWTETRKPNKKVSFGCPSFNCISLRPRTISIVLGSSMNDN